MQPPLSPILFLRAFWGKSEYSDEPVEKRNSLKKELNAFRPRAPYLESLFSGGHPFAASRAAARADNFH